MNQPTERQKQNDFKFLTDQFFNRPNSGAVEVKHKRNGKREYIVEAELKNGETSTYEYFEAKRLPKGRLSFRFTPLTYEQVVAAWREIRNTVL